MSEYTSTLSGFQRAMKWSLTGPPEDSKTYAEATSTPAFYQIMNGKRISYSDYVAGIEEWRGKISDYDPIVHEFLRDGNQLAARMTGTIKVDGAATEFESFMFAKVDNESGKLEWLVERSVWGPVGGTSEHGVS
ncbi:hypothetical protein HYFRA_00009546 [Hymenoscyphus fraxineus]|uniref:Uncharacterized protein n=1 Tax=Hymenoscyphus fraxineus TaxID=746836 RepID=A0A9N9L0Y7_9HELO|nr:hypothetical protein HYFRA_00009546 [Hymenoscyphus fraxineus]